jgi:hypothetical protein
MIDCCTGWLWTNAMPSHLFTLTCCASRRLLPPLHIHPILAGRVSFSLLALALKSLATSSSDIPLPILNILDASPLFPPIPPPSPSPFLTNVHDEQDASRYLTRHLLARSTPLPRLRTGCPVITRPTTTTILLLESFATYPY